MTPPDRVLRVGVIRGGKLVEERVLDTPSDVTLGSASDNTFVLPGLSPSFLLIVHRNELYELLFTDQMEGRVNLGAGEVDLFQAESRGLARRRGSLLVLPLTGAAKGKVVVGDATVLFQLAPLGASARGAAAPSARAPARPSRGTPARAPRPPEVEALGSVWGSMDRLFFGILAASLLVHFSGAALIANTPRPPERELALEELPDRFAKVLGLPKKQDQPPPKPQAKKAEEPKEKDDKSPEKEPSKKQASAEAPATQQAATRAFVQNKGLLKILGSKGSGGGVIADVLGASGANDVAEALSGAGGVAVATHDVVAQGRRGGGVGHVSDIGVATAGGGHVRLQDKSDAAVKGVVQDAAPVVDDPKVSSEALGRYVGVRKMSIQSCYERELKRNPSLRGRLVVRFTITADGRAGDIDFEQNELNDQVASCVRAVIRGWMFPFRPDEGVTVAYPFVFAPASG